MSDLVRRNDTLPAQREESERSLGLANYGLMLAAPITLGVTGLVAVMLAGSRKERAGEVAGSHFRFQLWTFGTAFFLACLGGLWFMLGAAGALAPERTDAGWLAVAGGALWSVAGIGYLGATVYGMARLIGRSPVGRLFGARS